MACANAVRGALRKFDDVDSVEVSLNKGLATVKLKPGNKIQPQQFWQAIHDNGFTPKNTHVVVRGDIVIAGGKPQLKVSGPDQVYDLVSTTNALTARSSVVVEGAFTPAKDLKSPVPLHVQEVR